MHVSVSTKSLHLGLNVFCSKYSHTNSDQKQDEWHEKKVSNLITNSILKFVARKKLNQKKHTSEGMCP